jgi:predicted small lipoprotein YifL
MLRCPRISLAVPLMCALLLSLAGCGKKEEPKAATPTAAAPAAKQSARETKVAGVVAELIESKRKDGVLTVQVRFRNTGDKAAGFWAIDGRNYDAYYVIAEDKKYLLLRDENKDPLSPVDGGSGIIRVNLQPQETWLWWAKYPAPPAQVKKFSYVTPLTGPFDDVPISDQ